MIPVSPSGSALHRLSTYERAPSLPDSESRSSTYSARAPSEPVPPFETIPSIPDYASKSTLHGQRTGASSSSVPPPVPPKSPKPSKLAMLASSRSTLSRTDSARTTGTVDTHTTVKTFPDLRPISIRPISLTRTVESAQTNSTTPSGRSAIVRQAIDAALQMEKADREKASKQHSLRASSPSLPPLPSRTSSPSLPSLPPPSSKASDVSDAPLPVPTKVSSHSKLAAKARSASSSKAGSSTPAQDQTIPMRATPKTVEIPKEVSPKEQQLSKLAQLAQAQAVQAKYTKSAFPPVKPPPPNHLPPESTEILTPISNGPTVTTAITTSYQSLYSLTDPARPTTVPAPFVVPLPAPTYVMPGVKEKTSKLAAKVKKAKEAQATPLPIPEPDVPAPIPPMFLPSSSLKAHPSAFAAVLIDGSKERDEKRQRTHKKHRQSESMLAQEPKHRSKEQQKQMPDLNPPSRFAFDVPSPDDVVLNARKGSALTRAARPTVPATSPSKHRNVLAS